MKIIGIYRGFPGLGRVVAGVELADYFRINYKADVKLFSYLQGEKYLTQKGYFSDFEVSEQDYSSIGIIPIGSYGEFIINQINNFNPDYIILDGEPLMTQCIKLVFSEIKTICLLNPFDVENPYNQPSSNRFLFNAYSQADLSIVHGLWKVNSNKDYHNLQSINTIVRSEVFSIKRTNLRNKISCILGGGSINAKRSFIDTSLSIAEKCIQMAEYLPNYQIHIYCSCDAINLKNPNKLCNVFIHNNIEKCEQYYSDSKLIISRAGRNTISELLCLGIPSIIIPAGDNFRVKEQTANAEQSQRLGNGLIMLLNQNTTACKLGAYCKQILDSSKNNMNWNCGNEDAIGLILKLHKSNSK